MVKLLLNCSEVINIRMSGAVIYDQRKFAALRMELHVKLSYIISKDFRIYPEFILVPILTREAFDTFETSWLFCLFNYQKGQLFINTITYC